MKHIQIVTESLTYGGREHSIVMVANALSDIFNVEIIIARKNEIPYTIDKRVNIHFLENGNSKGAFISFLKSSQADILISTTPTLHKYAGKYAHAKELIAWDNQNYYPCNYQRKLLRSIKKIPKLIISNADFQDLFKHKYPSKEIIYIPNALERIPDTRAKLDTLNILTVGKLIKEKGINDLVDVMEEVVRIQDNVVLNIIGDGPEKYAINYAIRKKHLEKNVIVYGYIDEERYWQILNNSSLFLIGSQNDAFSLSLLEAMSYGLPCLAFANSEWHTDLIKNELNGYIIPNRDKVLMAQRIVQLLKNPELLDEFGTCARETIMNYDIKIIKREWLKNL